MIPQHSYGYHGAVLQPLPSVEQAFKPTMHKALMPRIQPTSGDLGSMEQMSSAEKRIVAACQSYFNDVLHNRTSTVMLTHFSTMTPPLLQHAHANCSMSSMGKFSGMSGVRSYYDLLFVHFYRETHLHPESVVVLGNQMAAHATADIHWTWRLTGEKFVETIDCFVQFDEATKITAVIVTTLSDRSTSVLEAIPRSWPSHLEVCSLHTKWSRRC